jgi:hypothetical protein
VVPRERPFAGGHPARADGWVESIGILPGTHWRRGREHLRRDWHGVYWYHVDACDPWRDPLGHLWRDVLGL